MSAGTYSFRPLPTGFVRHGLLRDRLPEPTAYYASEGIKLIGPGAWRKALCPLHDDTTPSLSVRVDSGAFRCHACGAHGGDVVAFHMQRHELRFVDAAKALGAWGIVQ